MTGPFNHLPPEVRENVEYLLAMMAQIERSVQSQWERDTVGWDDDRRTDRRHRDTIYLREIKEPFVDEIVRILMRYPQPMLMYPAASGP